MHLKVLLLLETVHFFAKGHWVWEGRLQEVLAQESQRKCCILWCLRLVCCCDKVPEIFSSRVQQQNRSDLLTAQTCLWLAQAVLLIDEVAQVSVPRPLARKVAWTSKCTYKTGMKTSFHTETKAKTHVPMLTCWECAGKQTSAGRVTAWFLWQPCVSPQ